MYVKFFAYVGIAGGCELMLSGWGQVDRVSHTDEFWYNEIWFGLVYLFNSISTFVCNLMPTILQEEQ